VTTNEQAMTVRVGWLPDPFHRFKLRYWDGCQWTDRVSNGGVDGRDEPGMSLGAPTPGTALPAPSALTNPSGKPLARTAAMREATRQTPSRSAGLSQPQSTPGRRKAGPILTGLGAMSVGLFLGLMPTSVAFSDFGFAGSSGRVDVLCGSVTKPALSLRFVDPDERNQFYGLRSAPERTARVFEGKSATEVCDKELKSRKVLSLGAGGGGLLLVVIGLFRRKGT
jgi:Protein of unknown function (DUF2510)